MAWRAPTTADLIATLSKAEVDAFNQSVPSGTSPLPSADLVARTASFVRGFIRRNHHVRLGPAGTLPEGLISPAMDYAAFDVLKRLPVEVGAARVKAREEALLLFDDVAADKVTPEYFGEDEADGSEAPFPAWTPPPPYCARIVNGSVLFPAGARPPVGV
jgi:hypothetical protein